MRPPFVQRPLSAFRAERRFARIDFKQVGFDPFRGPDASLTQRRSYHKKTMTLHSRCKAFARHVPRASTAVSAAQALNQPFPLSPQKAGLACACGMQALPSRPPVATLLGWAEDIMARDERLVTGVGGALAVRFRTGSDKRAA